MSLIAALLLAQGAVAVAPATEAQEFEVIARRLQTIGVAVTRDDKGKYHCDLSQSTGLSKLDEQVCKAVTKCVRKGAVTQQAVGQCIDKARPTLIARIRDYMRAAQSEGGRS